MAGVAKVTLNGTTLMDVTDDTVNANNLLSGETALGANGDRVTGNVTVPTKTSELQNDSGFITTETDPTVPSWAKASSKPSYTALEVGAVSSIGVANATNGGISVSGSPVTSSGTITIGHSNTLASAQTTEAVYPIKIDKNGHISSYGTAATIPTASTTSPSMDGTASYGSGTSYARSNHVHPTDTSRQATLVSGTNIKTINNESLLGSGNISTGTVTDVQINGTSIISSGVANITDATYSNAGLINTGDQYFQGQKCFGEGVLQISNAEGTKYTELDFRDVEFSSIPTESSGIRSAYIINTRPNDGTAVGNVMGFVLRSPKSDGTGYDSGYESYALPTATDDQSTNASYDILTSKSPVSIEQGGTGATTLADVREKLQFLRMYTFSLASGTAKTLTVPSNSRHFVVVSGTASTRSGAFIIASTSAGSIGRLDLVIGTGLTVATSTNTLTLTAAGGAATVMVISIYGGMITEPTS